MIQTLLRLISTVCTAIVVLSFGMFAMEEANAGSKTQQRKIEQVSPVSPPAQAERAREKKHARAREVVDDANDALTKPFADVVDSSNIWVQRGIPALLAFLLYFVLLRLVAGYAVRFPL